ncbi:MAG: VWA domain-containing protein, partial [Clostridia bacterium]
MKKIIALILIVAVIVSGIVIYWNKAKSIDSNSAAAGPGTKEKTETGPKTGPVGKWDIPIPEINPLGAQKLYISTGYEAGNHTLKYIDNFAEYERSVQGEVWELEVEDKSTKPLAFLNDYAKTLEADLFSNQYGNRLTFSLKKDEESLWWGDAILSDSGYKLTVVKQLQIPAGKEKIFKPVKTEDEEQGISFTTRNGGKKFQSATIKIPEGVLSLEVTDYFSTGVVEKNITYTRELSAEKTTIFILDDLPQGEGNLVWNLVWESESMPKEISFLLEEVQDIPVVKQGDELGGLKVSGVPFGSVVVEPAKGVEITHADGFDLEADITSEGDSLFWLPAGYWNLVMTAEGAGLENSKTRLVPVSAGEMTEITLPNSLKSAYSNLNNIFASGEEVAGGIELQEIKDLSDKVSISMIVNDPKKRDIFPSKENTTITEGGKEVDIIDITRQIIPPSIVLVLDSSGSMAKDMTYTLKAAKEFVAGLPDKSFIKIIDFDSGIRILDGETKDTAIKGLSNVVAEGSTMLFDATVEGIRILEEKDRPAVVVFADGADSSIDGLGEGSSSSKEDVLWEIGEAGIPLFTIGFGEKPDEAALKEFAAVSGGQYYSAKNEKALNEVFAAINSKFGNSFTMTYQRPKEADAADTPVVSIVLDASGSMDIDPAEEEGCGYRIDKVKALFHDFIIKLPEQCLMQMISFQTAPMGGRIIRQEQVTTSNKANLLQGLGEIEAGGGTPILDSIQIAYENLKAVPSNKKVIVYLTDAALEVDEEEQEMFNELLGKIKKDNVTVLWAGMGVEDKKDVFVKAAELSGGRYVVSEDSKVLQSTLAEILELINTEKDTQNIPLAISINDKTVSGDILSYAASTTVNFTPPPKSGKVIEPDFVRISAGTPLKRYDSDVAAMITGMSLPSKDTILDKRVVFGKKNSNTCMELSINEAFYFSKFKGLLPPEGKQFLALQLDMKNIHTDKIQYQIPSMNSHFYVNINNEGMYPVSDATWLTQQPITEPGNPEINLFHGKDLSGMMMFIVPDASILQTSLHFYDTENGHINIPLVGKMDKGLLQLEKLPAVTPAKITDAFSMTVKASSMVPELDIYKAPEKTSFRVIEADFSCNVQALLDINPAERLWLKVNTAAGPLMTKMSEVTSYIPFGFMKPRMLAPASANKVRFAYSIANVLSSTETEIFGDIQNGSLQIPVIKGSSYGSSSDKPFTSGQGLQVRVNQLTTLDNVERYGSNWVVADVTFIDEKDGWGTSVSEDFFQLVRADYEENMGSTGLVTAQDAGLGSFASAGNTEGILQPENCTSSLLYGISSDWAVFDNAQRRGFVLFNLPDEGYKWRLKSPYLENLNVELTNEPFASSDLLVDNFIVESKDEEAEKLIEDAVRQAILQYNSTKAADGKAGYTQAVGLQQGDGKNNIPVPTIAFYGTKKIKEINSIKAFEDMMQGLRCIPKESDYSRYQNSPEAVLTQGWGTQWDLGNLAMGLVAKCGFVPKQRYVSLTQAGKTKLMEICKIEQFGGPLLPGVSYIDDKGESKIFVIPFMKNITELEGLVYLPSGPEANDSPVENATIQVSVKVESSEGSAQGMMSDVSAALGGADEAGKAYEYVELLSKEIPLPTLSLDAIEVGYMEAGAGIGKRYAAAISTPSGLEPGTGIGDSGKNKILGIKINITLPDGTHTHETALLEGETLDGFYHTLGINLPDLTSEAAQSLEDAFNKEYQAAKNPNSLSTLKWYGRNILNRFIAGQSTFDNEIGEDLKLTLGRTDKVRCIVLTSRMDNQNNKMRTAIDLLQAVNQCHNGDKKTQAGYNISAGMFISSLEGKALTGEDRTDFIELWS